MQQLRFLASLRSVRTFTADPVSRDQVEQIVDVARWTGSARNRQPWRFVAVSDQVVRRQLSELGSYAGHLATAPMVLVVLSEDNGRVDTEFDVGRVSQTICLAAHALGLGSCLATLYPQQNVAAAAAILGIRSPWLPRHAISLGRPRPVERMGPSAIPRGRLSVDQLLTHVGSASKT
jgi:nitroreductase